MRNGEYGIDVKGRSPRDGRTDIPHSAFRIPHFGFHAASNTATVSTCAVWGKKSNARTAVTR